MYKVVITLQAPRFGRNHITTSKMCSLCTSRNSLCSGNPMLLFQIQKYKVGITIQAPRFVLSVHLRNTLCSGEFFCPSQSISSVTNSRLKKHSAPEWLNDGHAGLLTCWNTGKSYMLECWATWLNAGLLIAGMLECCIAGRLVCWWRNAEMRLDTRTSYWIACCNAGRHLSKKGMYNCVQHSLISFHLPDDICYNPESSWISATYATNNSINPIVRTPQCYPAFWRVQNFPRNTRGF